MFGRSRSRLVNGVLLALLVAGSLLGAASCSEDDSPSEEVAATTDTGGATAAADGEKPYVPGEQDGTCPDDHPVKLVNQNGVGKVFATPGGDSYEEIRPAFCFRDVESAMAQDGYEEFEGDWPIG